MRGDGVRREPRLRIRVLRDEHPLSGHRVFIVSLNAHVRVVRAQVGAQITAQKGDVERLTRCDGRGGVDEDVAKRVPGRLRSDETLSERVRDALGEVSGRVGGRRCGALCEVVAEGEELLNVCIELCGPYTVEPPS